MIVSLISIGASLTYLKLIQPYIKKYKEYKQLFDSSSRVGKIYKNGYYFSFYKIKQLPTMDVDKFISMYQVNPEKWYLECGVAYKDQISLNEVFQSGIFFTPFSNFLKYEKMRNKIETIHQKHQESVEELENSKIQDEIMETLLESVKEDIEQVQKNTEETLKKLKNETAEIKLRLEKERKD